MDQLWAPLVLPLSGSSNHSIEPWAYWHARCMVLAWGVLMPLGALIARFYKITPRQKWPQELDNKAWWHSHRVLQYSGVFVMSIGAALAWQQGQGASAAAQWHAWAGWVLCVLGWFQVLAALLRGSKGGPTEPQLRGDHYDMTQHRVVFEHAHKGLGWLALLAAVAVTVSGLLIADAPRWMLLVLCLWWVALVVVFVRLQSLGRCVDTYQAIWGPSLKHPGNNQRLARLTGLGVRQFPPQQERQPWRV
jgi:hypothetical protein